jgi:hypothetical protein
LTPVWRTAAIHGRQAFGHVSESEDAPTAHSPADAGRGDEAEDHQLPPRFRKRAEARANCAGEDCEREGAAAADEIAEPAEERAAGAQPARKAAWIQALFSLISGLAASVVGGSCMTSGSATSVERCNSSPSKNQPSQWRSQTAIDVGKIR